MSGFWIPTISTKLIPYHASPTTVSVHACSLKFFKLSSIGQPNSWRKICHESFQSCISVLRWWWCNLVKKLYCFNSTVLSPLLKYECSSPLNLWCTFQYDFQIQWGSENWISFECWTSIWTFPTKWYPKKHLKCPKHLYTRSVFRCHSKLAPYDNLTVWAIWILY